MIIYYLLVVFVLCVGVTVYSIVYDELVTAWFARGMKVKMRYERGDYSGIETAWAAMFVIGFVILDFIGRNTVIVFRFRVGPKFELITAFIGDVTEHPQKYEHWQVAVGEHYRVVIIEPIDPEHFRKRPNVGLPYLIDYYTGLRGGHKYRPSHFYD